MQIEIQLDEERSKKLAYIQQQTQQNTVELIDSLIDSAIDQYYQEIYPPGEADSLAKLRQSKFIGCFQGSPDLSNHSKAILQDILQEKFSHNSQEDQ
jgi:hypothetical protein